MNFHDRRERLDYNPFDFENEARNMLEHVYVYFNLNVIDDTSFIEESMALKQLNSMFEPYMASRKVDNEGHDCYDNLLCKFMVENNKLMVSKLQRFIDKNHVSGDDTMYLTTNHSVSEFQIVERPGLTKSIPFEDWDNYIDSLEV